MKMNISSLEKIDRIIDKITGTIVIYSLSLMLALVFFQVVLRDLLQIGIYEIDELTRYLLVCFSFFSGSIALRRNELVGVTFAVSLLPIKVRRWIDAIRINVEQSHFRGFLSIRRRFFCSHLVLLIELLLNCRPKH